MRLALFSSQPHRAADPWGVYEVNRLRAILWFMISRSDVTTISTFVFCDHVTTLTLAVRAYRTLTDYLRLPGARTKKAAG